MVLMNKKIKEIDISAFRAYKNMQKFNFIHKKTGEIADLVTIYAPNGYGKTSFFDAVEWAITERIGRLGSSKPIQEELKDEENYILKNKDSKEDCGRVKIIDEDNHVIQVNTKKKKGNMKGDYKPGEIETISPELQKILDEKDTFCATNLLAHDKITGFLQSYTAEDKTNELRVMWDENNYSEILGMIVELYNELEKKKKQLGSDIKTAEKELGKYKYENDRSNKIKELIVHYTESYGINILETTDDVISKIDEVLIHFNGLHGQRQNEKEKLEEKKGITEILFKDFSVFVNNKKTKDLMMLKKQEIEKAIKMWETIEKDEKEKNKLDKELKSLSNVLCNINDFYQYRGKISLNNKELTRLEKEKIVLQKEKINIEVKIQEGKRKLKSDNDAIKNIEEELEQLRQDFLKYESNHKILEKYERLKEKAKYVLEQRDSKNNKLLSNINLIEVFLDGKSDMEKVCDLFPENIIDDCNSIKKLKEEKRILLKNIDIIESNRKNIVILLDKMQQLIVQGKDIVTERHQKECPLCHKEYRDYEELFGKITETKIENEELLKIDSQLEKNRKRKELIEGRIKELKCEISTKVTDILVEYKEQYENECQRISGLQKSVKDYKWNIENAHNICKNIEERYLQMEFAISDGSKVKRCEEEKEDEKKRFKDDVTKWSAEIEAISKKLEIVDKSISDYELQILNTKEENHKIETIKLYLEVEQFLKNSDFYQPEYIYEEMKEIIINKCNILSQRIKEIDLEIENCRIKVIESKEEYQSELNALLKEINELQVNITSYLLRCENVIGGYKKNEEILERLKQVKEEIENKLKIITEELQDENNILVELRSLKDQKMWIDRKQECELNKKKMEYLNKRVEKLEESKNFVEEFVVARTNEYFNSEIINQIYNKIDPHPTMKHIKFVTKRDKKGLKTHIYTYDESEDNKMSPVLYLSSAQVNILSLCIFLAKVLSEKDTTFNTIFMDDPIQHLDGINLLAFIDVLRTITTKMGRQIIISTHNEQFYKLLKVKMNDEYYPSKFIELNSTGIIK